MEKTLTRDELLLSLLKKARDPFTTMEQKRDVKRIMMESTTMRGMNHLFLVQCYFQDHPLFHVTRKEALNQAYLAFRENNQGAYYYLYLLLKDEDQVRARNYLRLACTSGNPYAFLEMGKLQYRGELFPLNRKEAYQSFSMAAKCGLPDGYFYMLLIASEDHDVDLEKKIMEEARKAHIELPGVVE